MPSHAWRHEAHRAVGRQRAAEGERERAQIGALDELEQDPDPAVVDAGVVEAHDVEVLDHGEGLGLLAEPGLGAGRQRDVGVDHPQGPAPAVRRDHLVHLGVLVGPKEPPDLLLSKVVAALKHPHVRIDEGTRERFTRSRRVRSGARRSRVRFLPTPAEPLGLLARPSQRRPGPGRKRPGPQPLRPGPRPIRPGPPRPIRPGPQPIRPGPRPIRPGPRPIRPGPRPTYARDPDLIRPGPQPKRPGPRPIVRDPDLYARDPDLYAWDPDVSAQDISRGFQRPASFFSRGRSRRRIFSSENTHPREERGARRAPSEAPALSHLPVAGRAGGAPVHRSPRFDHRRDGHAGRACPLHRDRSVSPGFPGHPGGDLGQRANPRRRARANAGSSSRSRGRQRAFVEEAAWTGLGAGASLRAVSR